MSNSEKFCNCRLIDNEISYIDKYWDGSFSEYVHNSIKRDLFELKNNKKFEMLQNFALYVIVIALGAIFFIFGIKASSVLEMTMSFALGVFCIVFGIIGGVTLALHSTRERFGSK